MHFNKYFTLFSMSVAIPAMMIQATDHATLDWYKLEVKRLHLLIQMDALALRTHYKTKIEHLHLDYEKRLNAAETTIHMQRSIIQHMQQQQQQKNCQLT